MRKINELIKVLMVFLLGASILTACTKEADKPATASSSMAYSEISPGTGQGNEVLTLKGSGLGEITNITFDNGDVPAGFNPVYNTENVLIFRVPDTANGGEQNIVITNKLGTQIKVPFNVIALPLVNTVSNYNFTEGTTITLVGNNLNEVSSVKLDGTNDEATVVSSTKKELVITMPATDVASASLIITNSTGPITTSQKFVNLDKAYKIFTEGYGDGYQDASWAATFVSSTEAKTGTKSVGITYPAGNWSLIGFGWNQIPKSLESEYTYLSFWIKGGTVDYNLWISTSASDGGAGSFNDNGKITVPANVWTYYKIPLSQLQLWKNASSYNQIAWRIQGPDGAPQTMYFDDIIFVK
ncbi:MAG: cell shape determination protein CcmA [Sphingobacteriaceae bacterium]|nr:MAG: cell shape determination protein CcmA [Sphingobacteriaceae bacterium]